MGVAKSTLKRVKFEERREGMQSPKTYRDSHLFPPGCIHLTLSIITPLKAYYSHFTNGKTGSKGQVSHFSVGMKPSRNFIA